MLGIASAKLFMGSAAALGGIILTLSGMLYFEKQSAEKLNDTISDLRVELSESETKRADLEVAIQDQNQAILYWKEEAEKRRATVNVVVTESRDIITNMESVIEDLRNRPVVSCEGIGEEAIEWVEHLQQR